MEEWEEEEGEERGDTDTDTGTLTTKSIVCLFVFHPLQHVSIVSSSYGVSVSSSSSEKLGSEVCKMDGVLTLYNPP